MPVSTKLMILCVVQIYHLQFNITNKPHFSTIYFKRDDYVMYFERFRFTAFLQSLCDPLKLLIVI